MTRAYRRTHPRVGRPGGPTPDRGDRPYDPQWLTPKRRLVLNMVYEHRRALDRDEILLCELAVSIGASQSYFSTTKNSELGQAVLRSWSIDDGEDPDQWSRL